MTRDKFIAEYRKVSERAIMYSEKARREGLLSLEDMIDSEEVNKRDILEYGLRFVVDGTDAVVIKEILENIIQQEKDKYARLIMQIKAKAVLAIQAGESPWLLAHTLNSFTDMSLSDDPIIQKWHEEEEEENDKGTYSEDELDALIGGNK